MISNCFYYTFLDRGDQTSFSALIAAPTLVVRLHVGVDTEGRGSLSANGGGQVPAYWYCTIADSTFNHFLIDFAASWLLSRTNYFLQLISLCSRVR